MNGEKEVIDTRECNSLLQPSSVITDGQLNEITAGFSSEEQIDKDKKIILVHSKGVTAFNQLIFQAAMEMKYQESILQGYSIVYAKPAQRGPQAG